MKRQMLRVARRRIVLADGSKIGQVELCRVCGVDEVDLVITGESADPQVVEALREHGARCRSPGDRGRLRNSGDERRERRVCPPRLIAPPLGSRSGSSPAARSCTASATLGRSRSTRARSPPALDAEQAIPVRVVHKQVLTGPELDPARSASRRTRPTPASASSPGCTPSRRRRCGSPASPRCGSRCSTCTRSSTATCRGRRSTWTS